MIAEIGLLIALYVIARLTAGAKPLIARTTAGLAIAIALLVGVDLAIRGFTSQSVMERLSSEAPAEDASQSAKIGDPTSEPEKLTGVVIHADGGSISTNLGYGIFLSEDSSLKREWIIVNEPSMPLQFDGATGIATTYDDRDLKYRAKYKLTTSAPIRAYEVQFLLFNVWGEHVRNLVAGEVEDLAASKTKEVTSTWRSTSNDAAEHYASIAYVARVRLENGRIIEAPIDTVLAEARKFSEKFEPEQLSTTE